MTLPASGQISFNDLRVEIGVPSQAPFSIADAATGVYGPINTSSPSFPNSSTPHQISEWYSYTHSNELNSGNNLRYATFTPGQPDDCSDIVNDYPSTGIFYSQNCTTLAAGCVVYINKSCATTAYNAGVRYINDGADYYTLDATSTAAYGSFCTT